MLFNIFLEQIMQETLHNHKSTISVGGRIINNLRFADDIDLIAGTNSELQELTNRFSEASKDDGMEVSKEKSKTMVNSKNESAKIMMDGTLLENVKKFKYLGSTLKSDGSSDNELRIRLTTATSAMVKLGTIWQSKKIAFNVKYNLYKSFILSIGYTYFSTAAKLGP